MIATVALILFLLALAALVVAFKTASVALLVICLIAAFGLTVAGRLYPVAGS